MSIFAEFAPCFLLSFVYIYTINCYFLAFFSKKNDYFDNKIYLLVLVIFCVCSTLTAIYKIDLLNLLTSIVFMVAITFFFQTSLLHRLVSVVILYITAMASEVMTSLAAFKFLSIGVAEVKNNSFVMFILMAVSKLIFLMIIKLFCPILLFTQKRRNLKIPKSYWILLLVPFSSIIMIHSLYLIEIETNDQLIAPFIITLILGINFLVFYLYDRILKNFTAETENRILKKQNAMYNQSYSEIESSQKEIRALIHDFENKILGLRGMIDQQGIDLNYVKNEMNEILGEVYHQPIICCGIPCLDIIINHKAIYAKEFGIRIKAQIVLPIETYFPNNDMGVILGNALDNAIEACKEVETVKRKIKILIKIDKDCLFIFIDNPYSGEIIADESNNPLSKRGGKSHGYGYKSIRNIVEGQGGHVSFQTGNQIFRLNIMIFGFSEQYMNKELASVSGD